MINHIALEFPEDPKIVSFYYAKFHKDLFEITRGDLKNISQNQKKNYIEHAFDKVDSLENSSLIIKKNHIDVVKANLNALLLCQPKDIANHHEPMWYMIMEEHMPQGKFYIVIVNYDEGMKNYFQKNAPNKKEEIDFYLSEIKNYNITLEKKTF